MSPHAYESRIFDIYSTGHLEISEIDPCRLSYLDESSMDVQDLTYVATDHGGRMIIDGRSCLSNHPE